MIEIQILNMVNIEGYHYDNLLYKKYFKIVNQIVDVELIFLLNPCVQKFDLKYR